MQINHPPIDLALEVRAGDYERFLAIQLAPIALRAALYAVTLFNCELSHIAETVSEPMLGHIRLAWWREALEEIIAGKPPRTHPVVEALAQVYALSPAVFKWLFVMLEARVADLDAALLADEVGWLAYLDGTAGALHRAWALILNPDSAMAEDAYILVQARRYAILGLVRSIPYLAAHGFQRFPVSRLEEAGVTSLAESELLYEFVLSLVTAAFVGEDATLTSSALRPLEALAQLSHMHFAFIRKAKYSPYKLKKRTLSLVFCVIKMLFK